MQHRVLVSFVLCITSLMLTACAIHPAPDDPLPALPTQWQRTLPEDMQAASITVSKDWWTRFGKGELAVVVEAALRGNQNIAAASARLEQAWALARMAGAARWPQVQASLDASRQGRLGGQTGTTGTQYTLDLTASYEMDLWGRLRAERDAAQFTVLASELEARTVALTISAETAAAWIDSQSLRQRLVIAQSDLDSVQRLLSVVRVRVDAGSESPLALAQQETLVANQRASTAWLHQQVAQADVLLALWMGQAISPLTPVVNLEEMRIPGVAPGLPSDLLAQRPDIQAAEARLRAADADVAAARAAMFPSLTLTVSVGGAERRMAQVLDSPVYALTGGLLAPIFNAGRLAAGHDLALSYRKELLAAYRQAVLRGFADVQVALDGVSGAQQRWESQNHSVVQAQRALSLALVRYQGGSETILALLDAQRSLYAAQDAAVQRQAERLLAAVALYRALGGGWHAATQS